MAIAQNEEWIDTIISDHKAEKSEDK